MTKVLLYFKNKMKADEDFTIYTRTHASIYFHNPTSRKDMYSLKQRKQPLGAVFYNEFITYCLTHTFIFSIHSMG